ncbi:ATP-dependent DNA helicase, partial [Aquabacterium sp. UBA2148]|uniref:ATP-dependent DNA helicase n=1 Tax=Aquabacterium sp. UBA2148 TaxID=1946042 RepID=UPI002579D9AB
MDPNELPHLFSATGPLARAFDGYCERREQIEMAQAVQVAIRDASTVVLEAGTGVGKTAAYLVPALVEGGKVIVSTGTKALQDQLFHRDLPAVRDALGIPVKVALLKGRSNYLCWHHLDRSNQDATLLGSKQEVRDLSAINRFAPLSSTGDKAECTSVPEHAPIWSRVTSTRENCLGSDCPRYADCFVVKARREAQDADVVVVNHHLFFADLMLREEGVPELLPNAQTIVFDEAHQLPDTATLFFGETVSTAQVLDLVRDTLAIGQAQARDAAKWNDILAPVERAARDLRLCFGPQLQRLSLPQLSPDNLLMPTLAELQDKLLALREVLEEAAQRGPDLANLHRRCNDLIQRLKAWGAPERAHEPELCWIDVASHGVQLHRTPISVADVFRRQRLGLDASSPNDEAEFVDAFAKAETTASADEVSDDDNEQDLQALMSGRADAPDTEQEKPQAPPRRAWVFTSATLAVKNDFRHFTEALGLEDAACASWASPYDYPSQAMLYVPAGLPLPNDPTHTDAVVDAALPLIRANRGRAFVLCT